MKCRDPARRDRSATARSIAAKAVVSHDVPAICGRRRQPGEGRQDALRQASTVARLLEARMVELAG
jgi:hypothetical protein